jgi:hypothetical protein
MGCQGAAAPAGAATAEAAGVALPQVAALLPAAPTEAGMKAVAAAVVVPGAQPAGAAVLEVAATPRPVVLLRAAGHLEVAAATRLAVLPPAAGAAAAGPRWLAVHEPLTAAQALEEEVEAAGPQGVAVPQEAWPLPPEAEQEARRAVPRTLTGQRT